MQTAEEIYQQYVKPLTDKEKLRLIAKVSSDLAENDTEKPKRSLLGTRRFGKRDLGRN